MAVVDGRLQIRKWQDKDGNNRYSAEVIAEHVYFGDSKKDASDDSGFIPPVQPDANDYALLEDDDAQLPF